MILLIDNYDSFTFNLVQLFPKDALQVMRNDDPRLFTKRLVWLMVLRS